MEAIFDINETWGFEISFLSIDMGSQYKSILKATSIFGGTQVFQLFIQLIRAKFIAVLIGATGMGISSMYTSSLTMIITIFGMGIHTSVIRDISKANDEKNEERVSLIFGVFKRMLIVLSLLGMVFVIAVSPFLSNWSFGNNEHVISYCFLSLMVLFTLLTQGNNALLIAKRQIKSVAKCSLFSSLATLFTSIPFFYILGVKGIVPGLVVSTISGYIITLLFIKKIHLESVKVSFHEIKTYGFPILGLGISMVFAALLGNITVYTINVCINRLGGVEDLGLYNAGMSITQNVVSLVFAAMAADYYPRLVASLKERSLMNQTINEQVEILVHLSVPILGFFSIFSTIVIQILLSEEFLAINSFVRILCFGVYVKVIAYALGYVSFAKGDKIVYVFLEGGYSNIANIILSVGLYYLMGLKGIAYAFVISNVFYYAVVLMVDHKRYGYSVNKETINVVLINSFVMLVILFNHYILSGMYYYFITGIIVFLSTLYNVKKLNVKTDIVSTIRNRLNK